MADTAPPETPDEPTVPRVSIARRFYRLAKALDRGRRAARGARLARRRCSGCRSPSARRRCSSATPARDFVNALSQRDEPAFWRNLWRYLATFALAIPVGAFYKFTADRLSLAWRDWMTNHLMRRYFYNRVYYRLRSSLDRRQPGRAHHRGRAALHDERPRLPADRHQLRHHADRVSRRAVEHLAEARRRRSSGTRRPARRSRC